MSTSECPEPSMRIPKIGFVVSLVAMIALALTVLFTDLRANDGGARFGRVALVSGFLLSFFVACKFVGDLIGKGGDDFGYMGLHFLSISSLVLVVFNCLAPMKKTTLERPEKKASMPGVILCLAISAIVFGFLDNFGLKLGTEALEKKVFVPVVGIPSMGADSMINLPREKLVKKACAMFADDDAFKERILSLPPDDVNYNPKHKPRFQNAKETMKCNLKRMQTWGEAPEKITNQVMFATEAVSSGMDARDAIEKLRQVVEELKVQPLQLPYGLEGSYDSKDRSDKYVYQKIFLKECRSRYKDIGDSIGMLGNTFSDFVGAMLGAGFSSIFTYLTAYDSSDDTAFFRNPLNQVLLEAVFIAIGCIIPVGMHYYDSNHKYGHRSMWLYFILTIFVVITVIVFMGGLMVPDRDTSSTAGGTGGDSPPPSPTESPPASPAPATNPAQVTPPVSTRRASWDAASARMADLSEEEAAEFTAGIPAAVVLGIFMVSLMVVCIKWQLTDRKLARLGEDPPMCSNVRDRAMTRDLVLPPKYDDFSSRADDAPIQYDEPISDGPSSAWARARSKVGAIGALGGSGGAAGAGR